MKTKAFHLNKTSFVDVISESTDNDVITTILTELSNHNKRWTMTVIIIEARVKMFLNFACKWKI